TGRAAPVVGAIDAAAAFVGWCPDFGADAAAELPPAPAALAGPGGRLRVVAAVRLSAAAVPAAAVPAAAVPAAGLSVRAAPGAAVWLSAAAARGCLPAVQFHHRRWRRAAQGADREGRRCRPFIQPVPARLRDCSESFVPAQLRRGGGKHDEPHVPG